MRCFDTILRIILFIFIIGCTGLCGIPEISGQNPDTSRHVFQDGWVEKMDRKLALRFSPNSNYETFRIETDPKPVVLYPNVNTSFQFGFFHRWLAVYINLAPKFFPGNRDFETKGKTEYLRLRLALNFHSWENELILSRVNGYYLQNTRDYIDWARGDPYIQYPNLQYRGLYGSSAYYLNPKFSYRHLSTQTERQLKSAGSFVPLLNYRYFTLDDQGVPLPEINTRKSRNLEFSLGFGYHHTFIMDRGFYISLGLTPGIGFINTKLTARALSSTETSRESNASYRWDGTAGLGYQGRSFFAGIYLDASSSAHREMNTTVLNSSTLIFYRFFVGWRITAPKPLNDAMDWAERIYQPILDKTLKKSSRK